MIFQFLINFYKKEISLKKIDIFKKLLNTTFLKDETVI